METNKMKLIKSSGPNQAIITYVDGSEEILNEDFDTIIILLDNTKMGFEIKDYSVEKDGVNFEITITNY